MEEFGGKLYFSAEEDEETNGDLEAETGEIHNHSHSYGFGEGKGGILARKEVDLHTAMEDDDVRVFDNREDGSLPKKSILATNMENTVRRPKLGFGGAPSQSNNGRHQMGMFNMIEFIRLAYFVIDEGDTSMTAFSELKSKWESRIGKEAVTRCFPITAPVLAKPRRQVWRNLLPSSLSVTDSMENRTGMKVDNQSSRSSISGKIVNNVLLERTKKTPEFANVEHDTTADADADITADVGHDTAADIDTDITADLCDDVSYPPDYNYC
ncbi:UNVERIFIED_CONTAM: hypothetical protein Sindi_1263500 [Sesamum indicum]